MIDFHSHILPGIDDGSGSVAESIEMLSREQEQGIGKVVATPHFYAMQDSFRNFQKKREESCKKLLTTLGGRKDIPQIYMGAEVYYFQNMGDADILSQLCIQGTSVVLLEMPFVQWTKEMKKDIQKLIEKRHFTLVLAHIERYYEFQKNKKIWNEVLELPVYTQLNAGSFLKFRKKKFCMRFIESNKVLLGSDCHNTKYRPPNIWQARKIIQDKKGVEIINRIDRLGEELLKSHE